MEIKYQLSEIPAVAKKLLREISGDIWLFYGKMGVGKTTLIKELCHQLGVEEIASSPSFGIVNEYRSSEGPVYHFDFYRIEDSEEAMDFGVEEYLYSGNKTFVEWPDKIAELLPEDAVKLEIIVMENGIRKLRIPKC